jgi:hypothetical protein
MFNVAYYQKLDIASLKKSSGGKVQGHHVHGKLISGLVYTRSTGSMLPQTIGRPGGKDWRDLKGSKRHF